MKIPITCLNLQEDPGEDRKKEHEPDNEPRTESKREYPEANSCKHGLNRTRITWANKSKYMLRVGQCGVKYILLEYE